MGRRVIYLPALNLNGGAEFVVATPETLVSLPDDDILEKERIDMKDIYVSSKLLRPVIIGVWYVGQIAIAVLFDPLAKSLGKLILVILVTFSIILVGLFSLLLIKVNNKYLLSAIHLAHAIGILLLRTN